MRSPTALFMVALTACQTTTGGRAPIQHLVSAEVRSILWNPLMPARVTEDDLVAHDAASTDRFFRVPLDENSPLFADLERQWRTPGRRLGFRSSEFDLRLVVLLTFADASSHRLAIDRGCRFLFADGEAQELPPPLFKALLLSVPENVERSQGADVPVACRRLWSQK